MSIEAIDHPRSFIGHRNAPYLPIADVKELTSLGRSTTFRLMAARQFPLQVQLTPRLVVWRRSDIERWFESRPVAMH
jgi:prophage regulatory protein